LRGRGLWDSGQLRGGHDCCCNWRGSQSLDGCPRLFVFFSQSLSLLDGRRHPLRRCVGLGGLTMFAHAPLRGVATKGSSHMAIAFPPLHQRLTFNTPLSEPRAQQLLAFLAQRANGTVVDVGCGWASLLLRLMEMKPTLRGLGIDLSAEAIGHAKNCVAASSVAAQIDLLCADVKENLPAEVQGAICIGASQIWGLPVEDRQPLAYAAALAALRKMVKPGAPVLYGEAIWSRPPTEAAVAPLAGRLDEFLLLPDLVDLAWQQGFAVVQTHEANQDEWDEFESGHLAKYACWLAEHGADHPDAQEVMMRAQGHRQAYFRGYRGVLGMAYLGLLAV